VVSAWWLVRVRGLGVVVALAAGAVLSCKPNLEDTVSIVTKARVLAIRSENDAGEAEFDVGKRFKMTALYVDVSGPVSPSQLQWALCDEPKPLAELGPVSPQCLEVAGDWFTPLGVGNQVPATMPANACQEFGPDPITLQQRPVDPDPTGGYYQPVQLLAPGTGGPIITIGETRIVCILASPSEDVRAAFKAQYVRNRNPMVSSLGVKGEPSPWVSISDANATPNRVAVGQRVALEVAWPACPPPAASDGGAALSYTPCDGAEHYLLLDTMSQALVDHREAIAVAWYATGGAFDVDRSGRAGSDPTTTSDNGWQAPSVAGPMTMWVVLRDERGGAGWKEYAIDVR
jgi:hypothetical protein